MKIALGAIAVLVLMIGAPAAYAQGGAYDRGFNDASCDAVFCHGHGYKPSCPSGHSIDYCLNYRDGYAAGWDASTNRQQRPPPPFSQAPSQSQSQAQNNNPTINIFPPGRN